MPAQTHALVTGASTGLGLELARLLAADGHSLILVARNKARLEEIAEEIRAAHGVAVYVLSQDLSKPGAATQIFDQSMAQNISPEILINNAGFGLAGRFAELSRQEQVDMIALNISALTELTHLFLEPMLRKNRGRILQMASTAGFQPGPGMAVYYATKAYVVSFSEALAHELKNTQVRVTAYCPGATATEFAARAGNDKTRLFQRNAVADARDVAQDAYRAMKAGPPLAIHGMLNRMLMESLRISPRSLTRHVAAWLNAKA